MKNAMDTVLMKRICAAALGLIVSTSPVLASDIVFGLGSAESTDQSGTALAFQLELHSDPIREYRWATVSKLLVAQVNEDNDAYIGIGLSALSNTTKDWFVEGSIAAGYYDAGNDGTDLGGNFHFRSLIGVGYRFSENSSISLAVDHISNAGIEDRNPGRNSVSLRYRIAY